MNTDIRLSVGFWQHPKTKKTVRRLGLEGVRSLQILWLWAAVNRADGNLFGMDWEDIELAADWQGEEHAFFDVCLGMWIDQAEYEYALHDWQEHNPWQAEADARKEKSRKAAQARWGNVGQGQTQDSGNASAMHKQCPHDAQAMHEHQSSNAPLLSSPFQEEKENTASASPAAEPAPTSSPDGGGESAQERAQAMAKAVKTTGKAARAASTPPDEPHYQAKSGRCLTGKRLQAFERFWRAFAFAKGKAEAADAWLDIPLLTDALVEHICHAAQCEARERAVIEAKGQTPKWAQGWLNARRWEDYPPPGAQARTGVGTGAGAGTATGIVPAHELPELTPEQQEAARQRRAEIVRERAQRREVVPMREAQA